uniref:Glycosyltransferase family 92 protein n=1 Tax=Acrobeloides nanus TaxID=290746 RepID=A0A914D0Y0_9BILA
MKAYEKDGLLILRPAVKFFQPDDLDYDPNSHNEWNNQDVTYNSCLYEFKDSAEFIMIADWDDVLVPKHHRNYFDELMWLNQLYPSAAAFVFSRPHSTLYT